jgi:hypothetical protein
MSPGLIRPTGANPVEHGDRDIRGGGGPDGAEPLALGMPTEEARAIAERAHRGQMEPSGRPFIDHVRRVAACVPAEAASVAWLHDVLEWTDLAGDDPVLAGLAPHERAALALLTRRGGDDDDRFLSHVWGITVAPGAAGELARAVKRADMQDRLHHPRDPGAAWRAPYARALEELADGGHHETGRVSPT